MRGKSLLLGHPNGFPNGFLFRPELDPCRLGKFRSGLGLPLQLRDLRASDFLFLRAKGETLPHVGFVPLRRVLLGLCRLAGKQGLFGLDRLKQIRMLFCQHRIDLGLFALPVGRGGIELHRRQNSYSYHFVFPFVGPAEGITLSVGQIRGIKDASYF